ncbi:alpha,alpha-trehalose-phosphate synthase 2 [Uncinocarpus reesii 1704]|uniref:Alpha,alpha-trehalose-phosphate synthase 2 n=1 Tax=Uncinocarpus reesii (strain UAMH 1704) TaxID=336963 RepID=C4JY17_UNCRE|nr:alpha,alpha-trehalose-phosphate synthase 2 [Uncinocarpus reesii 1704]EEP82203.1 alpha,alpha-trehalose-phosphate synthase 2 [Uncinocarpus reesii 1704]
MTSEKTKKPGPELLVVSNRLPVGIKRKDDGNYETSVSSGGLVSSLSGLSENVTFQWFGWTGIEIPDDEKEGVKKLLAKDNAVPVFFNKQLAEDHYNGFANSILWPVLHYQPGVLHFDETYWEAYSKVNQIFAAQVAESASDGDIIWIHDYHLMLLPKLLRTELKNRGKSAKIGFSLHTPFPVAEIYRTLPTSHEVLDGLLYADLIGFHTEDYVQHFVQSCQTILSVPCEDHKLRYKDRDVHVGKFVVGINPERFQEALASDQVRNRIAEFNKKYENVIRVVGVDRLDYIKGLPLKLRGFECLLREHPDMVGKIVLIQIAVPSREDVPEYQELQTEIQTTVGEINGKYGTPDYVPIVYVHKSIPFEELTALYAASDICLLTSTRDGMNLVAAEYTVCQDERNGVLLLSEFAGTSTYFYEGSIQFNPLNAHEISDALYTAAKMDTKERVEQHKNLMEFIHNHTRLMPPTLLLRTFIFKFANQVISNSTHWGKSFIDALSAC